ncbi:GNAT family N-acetyltransferase [Paenibacillus riograndensis]|uniref:Putative N-acetyltransferase YkwB n=1 Tax=Paenibacillus riograndensis SBR5 TaxID=1073571 RepID=A0A0E4CTZ9_9BACL|nr:GNAT family N-acetyltransferase [Paenibacillus riograndensis]CQR51267.1 putative N-acetyltransferase YkwB [Paenibacillus riograndensis SBR5]
MYYKSFYAFDGKIPVPAVIRSYTEADFTELITIQSEAFPPPYPAELWWNREQLLNHVTLFPEGALCVEVNGELAGSVTGLKIRFDPKAPALQHTWSEVTADGYITTHQPDGNTLYIADLCVRPKYRKLGLGKELVQSLYHAVVEQKLERLLGAGRMPGYHLQASRMSAEEYLAGVVAGKWSDPVITFLLRCGRSPVGVVADYLEDEESGNYAALMEWRNPFL